MKVVFALVVALCGACGLSAATDADVLDAALSGFVLSTDHCKESPTNDPVRVHDTTRQATAMTSDAQFRSELEEAQFTALAPLLDTFRKRNAAELPLAWTPSTPFEVVVMDLSSLESETQFMERYAETRCHARFWNPAFSDDQKMALVRFSWGPTAHGATATYFLERADDGWRILWKRIAIYA